MTNCPSCGTLLDSNLSVCSSCGTPLATSLVATFESPSIEDANKRSKSDRFAPGTIISNRYRLIEFIGRGGMGEVIRAQDQELDLVVALKFLSQRLIHDPRALDRVRSEVRMARLVSHPNVCRVHDLNAFDGQTFISMEYIDGEDLASLLLRVGRLAGDRALEIARELCAGLAAAHAAGVIHRDLKPSNIMLDRKGHVRITDFGLAETGGEGSTPGDVAGTPAYIAPEQIAGAGATIKSDLYALGLVLYELLTGHRVFSATTIPEMMRQRREQITPPAQIVREIDPVVEKVILQCLAKNPEDRPNSALEILSALSGGDPIKAALAAGQTPSPSDVAAAPVRGMLKTSIAWTCVLGILISLGLYAQTAWRISVLGRIKSPLKPEVLSVKAEEAMRALGYPTPCAYNASGFVYNDDALTAAANTSIDSVTRIAAEKEMIQFWHRCSIIPIMPLNSFAELTPVDPSFAAGDAFVILDLNGRLIEYKTLLNVQSSQKLSDPLSNFTHLADVESEIQDGKTSVNAKLESSIPISIQYEVPDGHLTSAKVVPPWAKPEIDRKVEILRGTDFSGVLMTIMIFASIPFAVHNLKSERADLRGALRVGLLVFGCTLVWNFSRAHHQSIVNYEMLIFINALAHALYRGVSIAFIYLALEPFVRRVWPENLVSWSRLLSGNWRDPMVARDILVGITVGWTMFGLESLQTILSHTTKLFILQKELIALFGLAQHIAITSDVIAQSIRYGMMFLLLLLLIGRFSRIRWLTLTLLFLILAGFMTAYLTSDSGINFFGVALGMLWGFVIVTIMLRFGLLSLIALTFVGMLNAYLPDATYPTEWTAFSLWWQIGLGALMALYGLYFATGRKPFGETTLLKA
jgi:hypothetical protein